MIDILTGTLTLASLAAALAAALTAAARSYPSNEHELVERINALLPQTQCAQCNYPGCRPYAEAIAGGEAINKCPPGGESTVAAIAELLQIQPRAPLVTTSTHTVSIREADCIGCTLCLPACPVDAIVGARRMLHTVIEDLCTGCDLCIEPCPVDCIDIVDGRTAVPALPEWETPCIQCGWCEPVCPVALSPRALVTHLPRVAVDPEPLRGLNLDTCIECKQCDAVCPSKIPLAEAFAAGKAQLAHLTVGRAAAASARARFESREQRLATPRNANLPSQGRRAALIVAALSPSDNNASRHGDGERTPHATD